MLDQHEAHDDRTNADQQLPHRDVAGRQPLADRPLADREVPLPGMAAAEDPAMATLHQWLDGELPEADARRADAKQVALWNRIATETDQRRRMATPAHVAANIMNALPAKQVVTQAATSVEARTATTAAAANGMPMSTVAMIGAAMLALGVVIGRMIS
jgi:hypothetical protein